MQGEQHETKGASGATAYTRGSEGLAPCMPSRHWCGPWRRSLVGAAGAHKTLQRTANITTQRCYEAAAVAAKTNEPKTQHGCTLDGNLNYHFCLAGRRMVSQRQSTRPGPWLRGLFGVHRGPRQPGVSWCESSLPHPRAPPQEKNRTITNPLLSLTLGGRPSKATGPGEQTN